MNPTVFIEAKSMIKELGEDTACAEILDTLESALGPDSDCGDVVRSLRNHFRYRAEAIRRWKIAHED